MSETPTVVLVHGAFADASSFAAVIPELLAGDIDVVAPAVPSRSPSGDAAYPRNEPPGSWVMVPRNRGGRFRMPRCR